MLKIDFKLSVKLSISDIEEWCKDVRKLAFFNARAYSPNMALNEIKEEKKCPFKFLCFQIY